MPMSISRALIFYHGILSVVFFYELSYFSFPICLLMEMCENIFNNHDLVIHIRWTCLHNDTYNKIHICNNDGSRLKALFFTFSCDYMNNHSNLQQSLGGRMIPSTKKDWKN